MTKWVLVTIAACGGPQAPAPMPAAVPVTVEWKAVQAPSEHVTVSVVVGGQPVALGDLEAISDDGPGTPATCEIRKADPTVTEFSCGHWPGYNGYIAKLDGRELVVSLHTATSDAGQTSEDKIKEIKRIPVSATSLTVVPYALPSAP